jgi:hypothetical protein
MPLKQLVLRSANCLERSLLQGLETIAVIRYGIVSKQGIQNISSTRQVRRRDIYTEIRAAVDPGVQFYRYMEKGLEQHFLYALISLATIRPQVVAYSNVEICKYDLGH